MLNDRVAVVTGGGIGIGKAIGVQLTKNESKVALASRNPAHLESAAAEFWALGLSILTLQMDVRSKHHVETDIVNLLREWGVIHPRK
jgi:NADP-dependent 3-hydroxy acid dehydrogenase YdfG